jgi:thiosulfate/3-mercaptopyruvate sulfurtransferase
MGTLISTETFETLVTLAAGQLNDRSLRVLDCRFSLADETAGSRQFEAGHIPGARYINLNTDLSARVVPGKTGRHPLPSRTAFAETLGRFGIDNNSIVVAYDDGPGAFAARLWWMLRWAGHSEVFVLDGGFKAWMDEGRDTTKDIEPLVPVEFKLQPPLTRLVSADDLPDKNAVLLDARDPVRFRGEQDSIDPVAGHIPGALCATFTGNLDDRAHVKPIDELRTRYTGLGVGVRPTVCYCGSGVTAAHNILALVHAGFPEPALYPGSWSEWITDPARPVERE